jgi:LacI family transcriptional regulator
MNGTDVIRRSTRRRRRHVDAARIAIAVGGAGSSHWHDVERGFAVAAAARGWRVLGEPEGRAGSRLSRLRSLDCDGLVAELTTPAEMRAALELGVPVVNVSEVMPESVSPQVTFDNAAIGRLAADHLLSQGFLRFACYGLEWAAYATKRRRAFVEVVEESGFSCSVLEAEASSSRPPEPHDLAVERWLSALPPHTGVFAVSDARAMVLLDACRRLGIDVPGRLGILGAGDCRDLCEASEPALSSIRRNGVEVGDAAARVLEELIQGRRRDAESGPVTVSPAGVAARESTAFGGDDAALVARAVTFIRDHSGERFGVEMLARKLRVSRRTLERVFHGVFGETPHVRLLRIRAEAALASHSRHPERSLTVVSRDAGFTDARHLRRVMKQLRLGPPR